jgi:hypothetical protein
MPSELSDDRVRELIEWNESIAMEEKQDDPNEHFNHRDTAAALDELLRRREMVKTPIPEEPFKLVEDDEEPPHA